MGRFILCFYALLLITVNSNAATGYFQYSGVIKDSLGYPLSGVTSKDITIQLYASETGGTYGYSQTFSAVPINNGIFVLNIGPVSSELLNTNKWLELSLNTTVLAPRTYIPTFPSSLFSEDSERLGGKTASELLNTLQSEIDTAITTIPVALATMQSEISTLPAAISAINSQINTIPDAIASLENSDQILNSQVVQLANDASILPTMNNEITQMGTDISQIYTTLSTVPGISDANLMMPSGTYISTEQVKANAGSSLFLTNDSNFGMVISSGGYIGINTAFPSASLDVQGDIVANWVDADQITGFQGFFASSDMSPFAVSNDPTNASIPSFIVTTDNKVGINNGAPESALDIVGSIKTSGNVSSAADLYAQNLYLSGNVYADNGIVVGENSSPVPGTLRWYSNNLQVADSSNQWVSIMPQIPETVTTSPITILREYSTNHTASTIDYETRVLNTLALAGAGLSSFVTSTGQFTLEPGKYIARFESEARGVDYHNARLQDITHAITLIGGTIEKRDQAQTGLAGGISHGVGYFELTEASTIELQHKADTVGAGFSFGNTGYYSQVEIQNLESINIPSSTRKAAFKATSSANQTIPSKDAQHQVTFDSMLYDKTGHYEGASSSFTAPVSGIYEFNTGMQITNVGDSMASATVGLTQNGTMVSLTTCPVFSTHDVSCKLSVHEKADAGDVFTIEISHNDSDGEILLFQSYKYFSGAYIADLAVSAIPD
jgi:hypothetical protein